MMKPEIKLYNTLTRQAEVFEPLNPQNVRMYVCGPTVYDEAHLGHARCYITWDVLYRFLTFMGYTVNYTRNITDVDDKIINRARENGEKPEALATRYTERFHDVMRKLNVAEPTKEPKATDYIDQMIAFTQGLIEKGFAYATPSGTVYYEVAKKYDYGQLCNQSLDDLQSGARVEVDPEKRSPLDFALWKSVPDTETTYWDSPWGKGRPGWHLECSVMSKEILGEQLDIHAGGMDLIFPHHQNEIAQSEALTGKHFVKIWMHNGFVNVSGEKMSKSLSNFSTIEKLLETYNANTLRYFILTNHYRGPVDFNDEALEGAKNRIMKINNNLQWLLEEIGISAEELSESARTRIIELMKFPAESLETWEKTALDWVSSMADDMNTAQALAQLNELLSQANPQSGQVPLRLTAPQPTALGAFLALSENNGFNFAASLNDSLIEPYRQQLLDLLSELYKKIEEDKSLTLASENTGKPDPKWPTRLVIEEIILARAIFRSAKNWSLSDMIRDRLAAMHIHVKDRKDGTAYWHYEPAKAITSP